MRQRTSASENMLQVSVSSNGFLTERITLGIAREDIDAVVSLHCKR